uniref:RxLR effector candidate protein n=1 Tax=Hyaloperonospora arabidopsidis (strain Emoy2) TaxID=559515 RepID=M4BMU7_HYAAE
MRAVPSVLLFCTELLNSVEALSKLVIGATEILDSVADAVARQDLKLFHASYAEMVLQIVKLYAEEELMGACK